MTGETWDRVKTLFDELEADSAEVRHRAVERLRVEDPNVVDALEQLLMWADHGDSLLDRPAAALMFPSIASNPARRAPEEEWAAVDSDRFRAIRMVGSGGMGTVFEAYDKVLSGR